MKFSTYVAATAVGYLSAAVTAAATTTVAKLLPDAQDLTLETWMTQLRLQEKPLEPKVHWIYLSGRETCNGTQNVCESFDDAMAKGYHVLKSQGGGAHDASQGKQQQQQSISSSPPVQFSYIDCDDEPILCHSWLLKPPAIMHITVDPAAEIPILLRPMRIAPSNKTSDDLYSDMTPALARKRLTPIINGSVPPASFHIWDGLMNPFTGHLGKLGLNVPWGWWTHHYGWLALPISWHAFCMLLLVICRYMVWQLTPKQNQTAAEMVMKPGVLGFDGDTVLAGEAGDDEDQGEGDEQADKGDGVKKEDKKDQ